MLSYVSPRWLTNNYITSIVATAFTDLTSATYLYGVFPGHYGYIISWNLRQLSNNSITSISSLAFSGLSSLTSMYEHHTLHDAYQCCGHSDMGYNSIASIDGTTFSGLVSLQQL